MQYWHILDCSFLLKSCTLVVQHNWYRTARLVQNVQNVLNMLSLEVSFFGLAKLKSHPGMYELDSKAVLSKEIREKLMEGDDPMSDEQRERYTSRWYDREIYFREYDMEFLWQSSFFRESGWKRTLAKALQKLLHKEIALNLTDINNYSQKGGEEIQIFSW